MKRIVVMSSLIWLLSIPCYSYAELTAPTGVTATEGIWSDLIEVIWDDVPGVTSYEVWRDSYAWCEGTIPCEPEFILLRDGFRSYGYEDYLGEEDLRFGVVYEYRIKACANDEITNEYICSDFSLPAYGYVLEDAPSMAEIESNLNNISCADIGMDSSGWGCGGGGGGGIFGDILKSSVIGYHLDGFTSKGVQVYMPVTHGFKALKGAQEFVRIFVPGLAEFVRKCFDFLELKADSNKEGFLYKAGTYVFPILGKIAEKSLRLIGEQKFIDLAYSDTTVSIEEFKRLEKKGLAIAPKIVKSDADSYLEISLTGVVY